MNSFTLFLIISLLSTAFTTVKALSGNEIKEKVIAKATNCLAEHDAGKADLDSMFAGIATMKTKCLRNCLMKLFNIMSDDGTLLKDGLINVFKKISDGSDENAGIAGEIADICGALHESDPCETAYKYVNCIKKEIETKGANVVFL